MPPTLYGYWRSSAAYRVRIALALKGADYTNVAVNIAPAVKAHREADYAAINPQMRVPSLEVDGHVFGQSMAMLEWIEETWPTPALLPTEPVMRARCRAFAQTIASDIHPIQNMSVLGYLRSELGADDAAVRDWIQEWITRGFTALEASAANLPETPWLFGVAVSFAEICLVPQMFNARRFGVDLAAYPRLVAIDEAARALEAFTAAAPEYQPDAMA